MLPSRPEITKAGEKVKCIIKIIAPRRKPHIMQIEMKISFFKLLSVINTIGRNVNSSNIKPKRGKRFTVAPLAAGHVQHHAAGSRLQMLNQLPDKGFCFFFVPLKIKFVIERGIKPVLIPWMLGHVNICTNVSPAGQIRTPKKPIFAVCSILSKKGVFSYLKPNFKP